VKISENSTGWRGQSTMKKKALRIIAVCIDAQKHQLPAG
jgi:hypothetical protein